MGTGGYARGRREADGRAALAGAVLAALLVADVPVAGPVFAVLTVVSAGLAVALRLAGDRPAWSDRAMVHVPFALALVLAGAAVWGALTGRDPATGLVATGLVLVAARIALPGRERWTGGVIGLMLAGLALAHRVL